jgi:putative membrane-bound dehydrogenase-like protein
MIRFRFRFSAGLLFIALLFGSQVRAAQFKFATQTFTVPDGFEIELISDPSLVERPISASFDEQGRLYVTDSSGSNDKPDKQLQEKPHRVVRLEDTNGDGKFDRTVVFADKMMFPEGCLWYDGSLYVAAPPSIWKLTDTNNDGIADVREEWHQGKTLTGCANDLHGPYLGLDGWIYWCKGAFAEQRYTLPNGKAFASRAAHIFRARPDHSELEPVMTGGMDNPVGLAFTAEGERILCGTFFAPHEPGHRDGLIHAIYGGVYGKINDVTDAHKKTGELMPVMTHMGPAAPCSVIRYESKVFGEEYRDNLFVCAFNLHKVSRHILEPDGATFKTKDSDFLVSDNPDFHPTDVIEDADGSLIVLDTGGWYKLCCPTSQLMKPDVLGAIYRVRKAGAKKLDDPRGLKLQWAKLSPNELGAGLGDERVYVQRRAVAELARRGHSALGPLERVLASGRVRSAGAHSDGSGSTEKGDIKEVVPPWPNGPAQRQKAIWALTRIDSAAAREQILKALHDADSGVRCAALQSASLHRDGKAAKEVQPFTVLEERLYLELVGRTGQCEDLLEPPWNRLRQKWELRPAQNRILQHAFSYALIEADAGKTGWRLFDETNARPAALIALDQMDDGGLKAETVAPLLASSDPDLRKAAVWVAGHHPDWGDALADFFKGRLAARDLSAVELEDLGRRLSQFARSEAIQELMGSAVSGSPAPVRRMILQAMAAAGLKQTPGVWSEAVRFCLTDAEENVARAAINAARALAQPKTNAPNFSELLLALGRDETKSADLRLEALAALPSGMRSVDSALFQFLCASVDSSKPVTERGAASTVLAKAKLKDEQLLSLADTVKSAGPLEMTKLLAAFEHSRNEPVGLKLMSSLKEAKSVSSLRPDLVKAVTTNYPAPVQEEGQALLLSLNADSAKQAAHVDELVNELKNGDIRRGQLVFNSQKAACASCHTMGYLGGKVGPDLTSIGQVRTERDLLESILYPSASFVRSYEPYVVSTKSDESYTGVLKKDAPDEVILATGPGVEVRIPRGDVVDVRPGTISVMPAGLEQQLTKTELADLLAFLKSTKWGPH